MFKIETYILVNRENKTPDYWYKVEASPEIFFVLIKNDKEAKKRYSSSPVFDYNLNNGSGCLIIKYYDIYLSRYSDCGEILEFWRNLISEIEHYIKIEEYNEINVSMPGLHIHFSFNRLSENLFLFKKESNLTFWRNNTLGEERVSTTNSITKCELPIQDFLIHLLEACIEFCEVAKEYLYTEEDWMHKTAQELLIKLRNA